MSVNALHAVHALNRAFVNQHTSHAQLAAANLSKSDLIELFSSLPSNELLEFWSGLTLDLAAYALKAIPENVAKQILQQGEPVQTARALVRLPKQERTRLLALVDHARKREMDMLVEYPEDSAGALMDVRFVPLSDTLSVREAMHRIRKFKPKFSRQLYLVDSEGRLCSMIEIHQLALAEPRDNLTSLAKPIPTFVTATTTREEVVEQLDTHRISDLPVVDLLGRLVGVIRYDALMDAMREESSVDMLTMVGASRDERALSPVSFVVRKRLPWLTINLLTAFLAAAVVGMFEGIIAKFTALAVLLPVVAGQSGNTGAQALAVTMRSLALREIGTSHWLRVTTKETGAAFFNGVAIAIMTSVGVLIWSSSAGLAIVIGISMVLAMVAAAISGVIIPIILSSLGQDPAQSSSIILTTVTDVVGFFTFLGIATLLSGML